MTSYSDQIKQTRQRGFNLIESAIVLAVIGVFIGSLWTAAAYFQEKMHIKRTVDGVLLMSLRGQQLLPVTLYTGSWYLITDTAINMGIAPADWIQGSALKNPWGGYASLAVNAGTPVFEIYIGGLNEIRCRQLLSRLSSSHQSQFILSVWNGDKAMSATLPISYNHSICLAPIATLGFMVKFTRAS